MLALISACVVLAQAPLHVQVSGAEGQARSVTVVSLADGHGAAVRLPDQLARPHAVGSDGRLTIALPAGRYRLRLLVGDQPAWGWRDVLIPVVESVRIPVQPLRVSVRDDRGQLVRGARLSHDDREVIADRGAVATWRTDRLVRLSVAAAAHESVEKLVPVETEDLAIVLPRLATLRVDVAPQRSQLPRETRYWAEATPDPTAFPPRDLPSKERVMLVDGAGDFTLAPGRWRVGLRLEMFGAGALVPTVVGYTDLWDPATAFERASEQAVELVRGERQSLRLVPPELVPAAVVVRRSGVAVAGADLLIRDAPRRAGHAPIVEVVSEAERALWDEMLVNRVSLVPRLPELTAPNRFVSDQRGVLHVQLMGRVPYLVYAQAPGATVAAGPFPLTPGSTPMVIDLPEGSIAGRLDFAAWADDRRAAVHVTLCPVARAMDDPFDSLFAENEPQVVPSAEGAFAMRDVPAGDWLIRAVVGQETCGETLVHLEPGVIAVPATIALRPARQVTLRCDASDEHYVAIRRVLADGQLRFVACPGVHDGAVQLQYLAPGRYSMQLGRLFRDEGKPREVEVRDDFTVVPARIR